MKATTIATILCMLPTIFASTTATVSPSRTYTSSTKHYYELYSNYQWCPSGGCGHSEAVTFAAGLSLCNVAGHLVDITTPDEQVEIHNFLGGSRVWLGLTYDANNMDWLLSDGTTTASYFHWYGGSPLNTPVSNFPCNIINTFYDPDWVDITCSGQGFDLLVEYDLQSVCVDSGPSHHGSYY
jgi:hypothetical protein